jgi:hypothetical protein
VARAAEICKDDKLADRSDAIAQLIQDELEASTAVSDVQHGPMSLLREERQVQEWPGKMAWLFEPYLQDLYERRLWKDIESFESASVGAHLVGALVLATARTGEFITNAEVTNLEKFHGDERRWLTQYLLSPGCDGECKGRLVDVMLASYGESQGDYDEPFRKLLERPRNEAGPAVGRLHGRLLWCQMDAGEEALFRDKVLVPALDDVLKSPKPDSMMLGDLAGLLALTPETQDGPFRDVLARLQKLNPTAYQKTYASRRAIADRERRDPPPAMRNVSFCGAGEIPLGPQLPQK